jgi:hypothetical protein
MAILNNGQPFVTTTEIVTLSGKHSNTVYSWIKHENIKPVMQISNSYLFDKKAIVDFLRDRYGADFLPAFGN